MGLHCVLARADLLVSRGRPAIPSDAPPLRHPPHGTGLYCAPSAPSEYAGYRLGAARGPRAEIGRGLAPGGPEPRERPLTWMMSGMLVWRHSRRNLPRFFFSR